MSSDLSKQLFEQTRYGKDILPDEIIDTLGFFDDWEERYGYIIDLGKALPVFTEDMQTDDRIVHGCQSQLWLEVGFDDTTGKVQLAADSDAIIVRGLIAIVFAALNNKTPAEIQQYDMEPYFTRIDLVKHLSPKRGNGLKSMVERIRKEAAQFA